MPPPAVPSLARPAVLGKIGPLFKLRSVSIEGAHAIPPASLRRYYERFLGRRVSKRDIESIAAAISHAYREAGYHLSRAIIPPQNVNGGYLTVRVIEGSITDIRLKGLRSDRFGIRALLNPILKEHPSRLKTVERQLSLVNDTPGVRVVDVALQEIGTATGQFRLIVKVKTWHIYANLGIDNYGTYAVGPLQSYATTSFNSYLRPGDSLSLNFATVPDSVRDLRSGGVAYDVPIADGLRVGFSALQGEVMPDDERRMTDTRALTRAYEMHASILALARRESWLSLRATMAVIDSSQTETTGVDYSDRVSTLRLAADYRLRDPFGGLNFAGLSWRQGLNAFGVSQSDDPLISRYGATPNFSILNYSYTRLQKIYGPWSFKASIAGQFASGPLVDSQQFYLGGAAFGPGYYSGDDGYAGEAELRFDQHLNGDIVKAYQLFGFIDGGQAWYLHQPRVSLSSAGAGVRFEFGEHFRGSLAVAAPVSYTSTTEEWRRVRVLFSISRAFKGCVHGGMTQCP